MIEIPSHFWLNQPDIPFPDLSLALKEPNGLIAIGGDLSIERLLDAYSKAYFHGTARANRFYGIRLIREWL